MWPIVIFGFFRLLMESFRVQCFVPPFSEAFIKDSWLDKSWSTFYESLKKSRGCQSKILIVEPIKLNRNQSNWLVESIELNRIDRSDDQTDRWDNRIQSNIYMFFSRLIGFDWIWLIRSISVRLIRSVSLIDLLDQFDWFDWSVWLNSTDFT